VIQYLILNQNKSVKSVKSVIQKQQIKTYTPATIFFALFSIFNAYILMCFIVVLATQTQFWLFLPGYAIGVFTLSSPVLLFVYTTAYLVYKKYHIFKFQQAVFLFNFLWLIFLFGSLIYELIFYKEL